MGNKDTTTRTAFNGIPVTRGISNSDMFSSVMRGEMESPDTMQLGVDCKYNHGVEGNTLRYKSNNACVMCVVIRQRRRKLDSYKKKPDYRETKALKTFEDIEEEKEIAKIMSDDPEEY